MLNADLTLISFLLAMLLGVLSLFIIRRTADEYERAILGEPLTRLAVPALGTLAAVAVVALLIIG